MVMVKEQDTVFPLASSNVYVTVVIPIGKLLPWAWDSNDCVTDPELSVAVGTFHVTIA